jgi:hypothetical protein
MHCQRQVNVGALASSRDRRLQNLTPRTSEKLSVWNSGSTFSDDVLLSSAFFNIFFLSLFAKIYGPHEILRFYTSAAVAHDGRVPTAARHGGRGRGPLAKAHTAMGHDVRSLPPCRTVVGA